jgi:PleD family two-component response regulator
MKMKQQKKDKRIRRPKLDVLIQESRWPNGKKNAEKISEKSNRSEKDDLEGEKSGPKKKTLSVLVVCIDFRFSISPSTEIFFHEVVKRLGHTSKFVNFEDALEILKGESIDLVICPNIVPGIVPGMDSSESITKKLREQDSKVEIILTMFKRSSTKEIIKAMRAGVYNYWDLPIKIDEIKFDLESIQDRVS